MVRCSARWWASILLTRCGRGDGGVSDGMPRADSMQSNVFGLWSLRNAAESTEFRLFQHDKSNSETNTKKKKNN